MTEEGIGAAIRRKEDFRFLVGRGRFIDDLDPPGLAHCFVQRAPLAHARIVGLGTANALAAPGVLAVFTGADMAADGIGPMRCMWPVTSADGTAMNEPERWVLARGMARYQGEPVAAVIAETAHQDLQSVRLSRNLEGRVFFHDPRHRGGHLVQISLRFRKDGHLEHGLWELEVR